ncbi:androglobin-like isoform X2 [Scaptodrosophila lebanonensis]|uniref:Androglobin-like isoform X2 n=1 Tax=Drosophila lebanonensis TaxID=7225 RepID=A0A6J2TD31_DROLE|nr:androglobin-like isoform X2 [Scaptodrosophila lebanonensis]
MNAFTARAIFKLSDAIIFSRRVKSDGCGKKKDTCGDKKKDDGCGDKKGGKKDGKKDVCGRKKLNTAPACGKKNGKDGKDGKGGKDGKDGGCPKKK